MRLIKIFSLILITPLSFAQKIDIQGHRGARGLMPENTIEGFIRALQEGVTTLELDVVITKDRQVLVSHEPYMSSAICTKPDGSDISKAESKDLNIYEMTFVEVKKYDCGSKGNSRFPLQEKMPLHKPLLSDLLIVIESYLEMNRKEAVSYNIEIKSSPKGDDIYHPGVEEFSQIVHDLLKDKLSTDRFTIQSFDFRVLKHWHQVYPDITLVALIENTKGVESNLNDLGFIPEIYSPCLLYTSMRQKQSL